MTHAPPQPRTKFPTKAAERAYDRGRVACRTGASRGSNPYHCAASQAAVTWNAWREGYDFQVRYRIWSEDA